MNVKQNSNNVSTAASTLENDKQSTGIDSRNTKRNSGLFSFFKWLKNGNTSTNNKSRDSLSCSSDDKENSSNSCESLNSVVSSGTVASFSFVDPNFYTKNFQNKIEIVQQQIETNTYKERLKQRDKRREKDKNLTLRKKYNLFFNRDTTLKHLKTEETTKSLPLMTKPNMKEEKKEENCHHRRTNSDSSKIKKAGAYLHVKGKRKAPPPPGNEVDNTASLKRKNKRLAPKPPNETTKNKEEEDEIDVEEEEEIISNDYLKLDHGILKQVKQEEENVYAECSPFVVSKSNIEEKFWYKRNDNAQAKRDFFKKHENKYEPIEKLPEVSFNRNSTIDIKLDKKDDKRKSGLPNISELDREAAEILKKEKLKNFENLKEIPEFMKLKNDNKLDDTLNVPKRKSAKDLIAKFNAITNVTKVTVNSALFGTSNQNTKNYFGKTQKKQQETRLETHKKRIEEIDKKLNATPTPNQIIPLIKSESVSVMKKPETPKNERKNWNCPKCYSKNEYWRIICQVCSKIKPYFDDLTTTTSTTSNLNKQIKETNQYEKILERSKTQIGFSALTNYNNDDKKREEKEKLKKMLIDMKNSLPKKNQLKKASLTPLTPTPTRTSIIMEKQDTSSSEEEESSSDSDNEEKNAKNNAQTLQIDEIRKENAQGNAQTFQINEIKKGNAQENAQTLQINEVKEENAQDKVVSIIVGTKETIYENIKMKNNKLNDKPLKISSSVQTTSVIQQKNQKKPEPMKRVNVTEMIKKKNNFEPMKIKDFEDIYNEHDKKSSKIYANLAQNDQLSLFFNAPPTNLTEMKNTLTKIKLQNKNKDTIEINRLLRRLEIAISKGDLTQAADFAKELAQLKVNCSVIRQKNDDNEEYLNVDMYVEDKISHRGPFPIRIKPNQTVKELKEKVEKEFEIPINVQRWILGKELITNDKTTLISNGITNGSPIFLYLVAPPQPEKLLINDNTPSTSKIHEETPKLYPNLDKHFGATPKIIDILPKSTTNTSKLNDFNEVVKQTITTVLLAKPEEIDEEYDNNKTLKPKEWECHLCTLLNPIKTNVCGVCATVRQNQPQKFERKKLKPNAPPLQQQNDTYLQLMNLDNEDLITNIDEFECLICFINVKPKEGVTLRECLHQFCKDCLRNNVEYCEEAEVKCPYRDENYSCNIPIQDREIKSLVSKEMYDKHLIKSMIQAENKIDKSFHCKTPDCKGWCIFEDNVNEFKCPVCRKTNCLTCQAIHMGLNCKQYQQRMLDESECDENAKETRKMLDEMVENGEALKCPTCQVIMMKKWGCDWLRCSVCKTEICWVTKGPRWGPDGKGDISGGCQCGVNGVKCHPKCNYCH